MCPEINLCCKLVMSAENAFKKIPCRLYITRLCREESLNRTGPVAFYAALGSLLPMSVKVHATHTLTLPPGEVPPRGYR